MKRENLPAAVAPDVLCIGLNVGATEPTDQLNRTLGAITLFGRVLDIALGAGIWGDCGERMLQIRISPSIPAYVVAEKLARHLQQECVGVLTRAGADWVLIWSDGRATDGGTIAEFPLILQSQPTIGA